MSQRQPGRDHFDLALIRDWDMMFMYLNLTLVWTTAPPSRSSLKFFRALPLWHAASRTVGMPLCDNPSSPVDLHKSNWLLSPPGMRSLSRTMVRNCDGGAPHNTSPAAGPE